MFKWVIPALAAASCLATPVHACDGVEIVSDAIFASPVCIPKNPQRVVVLDPGVTLGAALEMGLPVVGAPLTRMGDAALQAEAEAAGVEDLGFVTQPDLEKIVALQPDLILALAGDSSMAQMIYPMASTLAPTLVQTSPDWRAFYQMIAQLTGKEAELEADLAALDARIADLRAKMPETPVSILRITSWDFQVYTDSPESYAPFVIAAEAGLIRSAYEIAPEGPGLKRPDWEELAALDGEILLYIVGGTNDSDSDGRHEEVLSNPLWQMLPAVQAGRVHRVDHGTWMEFNGLRSAHKVLDDLETYVIGSGTE